ncbi:MAG: hypothetical protein SGI73_16765 [Chloroflexota bacterium]|nr:hypothetical protein [Chloroflexota bacterium]
MACPLNDAGTAALDTYFTALAAGERAPGRPLWGASYDLVE